MALRANIKPAYLKVKGYTVVGLFCSPNNASLVIVKVYI